MKLSDAAVRKLKPTGKPYKKADEKGLFLLITPAGSKGWRFKYRFDGREKLLSLGVFPEVTLAEARRRRDEARQALLDHIDPSRLRQEARAIEKAERLAADAQPQVVSEIDGTIEIRKGRTLVRLSSDEAKFVSDTLFRLVRS